MENMQCSDSVDIALAELIGLQNRNLHYTPGTTTLSSSPSFGQNRKFNSHFSCQGISSGHTATSTGSHQNVQMNQKYVSKILNSPRKACELPAFRMRPYFLPERSRTKSESLDLSGNVVDGCDPSDSLFGHYPMFTTSTTNSASYSMMSTTLMDTSAASSRSPGLMMPHCSFDYDPSTAAVAACEATARGYSNEPRRMRLKMINAMKKSKSLEDVRAEGNSVDGSQLSHEMEFVSSRIQKLKVQEPE